MITSRNIEGSTAVVDPTKPISDAVLETQQKQKKDKRLPAIQVLRGIAAVLVVFHHSTYILGARGEHTSWFMNHGWTMIGASGVDIFFVISGFIMFYTTTRKIGIRDAGAFLWKRALRIYPLYWLWTSLLLLIAVTNLVPANHKHNGAFFLASYLLIPVFNGFNYHPFLDQGWTLSFEMLFYGVFAIALWLGRRSSIVTFLAICFTSLFVISWLAPLSGGLKFLLSNTLIIEFLFGVGLAKTFLKLTDWRAYSMPRWLPAGLVAFGVLLVAGTTLLNVPSEWLILGPWRFVFWGIPSALIVAGGACWNQSNTNPALVYLGDASYTIYLAHNFFLGAFGRILGRSAVVQHIPGDFEMLAVSVLAVACMLPFYQWVERPLTSWLRLTSPAPRAKEPLRTHSLPAPVAAE